MKLKVKGMCTTVKKRSNTIIDKIIVNVMCSKSKKQLAVE